MRDICNYSLQAHNTFGIDARCSRFLEYENEQEAQQVAQILNGSDTPYIIIGGGSNLLLTQDYEGIVVHSAIKGYEIEGTSMVCGSGMVWDDIVAISLQHELYGAENLSLIPGDVGASAVQNIAVPLRFQQGSIAFSETVSAATGIDRAVSSRNGAISS